LALGLTVAGGTITQIFAPVITQHVVDNYGWRTAYVVLGLGWSAPPLLLAYFFLRDARDRERQAGPSAVESTPAICGLTLAEALHSLPLIRIAISTLLTIFIGTAILVHQVPILTATGLERSDAALLAGLSGVAAFIGKLMTGWMVDRWDASLVGAVFLLAPAVGYWLLLSDGTNLTLALMAMFIIGYTAGAKLQICAYLTAQYAGMLHFGKIFGVMTSIIGLGGGVGSIAAGAVYGQFGGYGGILSADIVLSFLCSAVIFKLGAYPDWSASPTAAAAPVR